MKIGCFVFWLVSTLSLIPLGDEIPSLHSRYGISIDSEELPPPSASFLDCGGYTGACADLAKQRGYDHYFSRYDRDKCGPYPYECYGY